MKIVGTSGDDTLIGTTGNDIFELQQGGDDTVLALGGNDIFNFGAAFSAADSVNGGRGDDTLRLDGDYSAGVTFAASTMTNVERLVLLGNYSYALTTNDASVAAGQTLLVDGSGLGPSDTLIFDGAAETNGSFRLIGGAGDDILTGGAGRDVFDLQQGGDDTVSGGGGKDVFDFGATFTATDNIDGGAGTDTLRLDGNYQASLTLAACTLVNVERIVLGAGHSYMLTTDDANVAAGQTLTVDGGNLDVSDHLRFNGAAETDGSFRLTGGAGNDILIGGAGRDIFELQQGGSDTVHGGGGNDVIEMGATFDPSDIIDGGPGHNMLVLDGNYSGWEINEYLDPTQVTNIQKLVLGGGCTYGTESAPFFIAGDIAAGDPFTIDGTDSGQMHLFVYDISSSAFSILGGAGNDIIEFDGFNGAQIQSFVSVDGGGGSDTLAIDDCAYADIGSNVTNIQTLLLSGPQCTGIVISGDPTGGVPLNIDITSPPSDNPQLVQVDASGSLDPIILTGTNDFDSMIEMTGSAGNDTIIFYGSRDPNPCGFLGPFAVIDGGPGFDTLVVGGGDANFTHISSFINIEQLDIVNASVKVDDTDLAPGQTLIVKEINSYQVIFDGSAVTVAQFDYIGGGAENSSISTGAGNDTIDLSAGSLGDTVTGGCGADDITLDSAGDGTIIYTGAPDSTGPNYDTIHNLNFGVTKIYPGFLPAIDPMVTAGSLSTATFDSDLQNAIGPSQLHYLHAVIFEPNAGTLAGHAFLIIDDNGQAGYQAEADLVIDVTGFSGALTTASFSG